MAKELTYEQAMTRLEEIVAQLEGGKCTLDESMKLFEEGAKMTDFCRKALSEAEQKITKLQANAAETAAEE